MTQASAVTEHNLVSFVSVPNKWTGVSGASDNDVLYTSPDVSKCNYHIIENRSAVAIDVHITVDGTFNASQPALSVTLADNTTAGKAYSATIPANKTGIIEGRIFNKIRVDQAAAGSIAAGAVVGFHGIV